MIGSTAYQKDLWAVALSKLPKEQQDILTNDLALPVRYSELSAAINESREKSATKWRFKTRHGAIDIRDKFGKIVTWVQKFIAIGDTVVTYDPGHAALPWAAVRLILQVMVNNTTRTANFAAGLETVAFYIYDCTVRENLYLNGEPSDDGHDLEKCILDLFTTILQFLLQARVFFEAGTTRRMLSSTIKSADEVIRLLEPAFQHARHVITVCGRIDARSLDSISSSVINLSVSQHNATEWLRRQLEGNELLLSSMTESMALNHRETMTRFDAIDKRSGDEDRLRILSWLSPIPYFQHHKRVYGELLQGTGQWLLEDNQYAEWRDSNQSAMLWLHGIPGSGKSKLVSLSIQEALESDDELPQPLFFYCSRNAAEPERASAEDIARSLVRQLSANNLEEENNVIPQYVANRYKKARDNGFAAGKIELEECCDFISTYVKHQGYSLIFIDGLDECTEEGSHSLIRMFNEIFRSSATASIKLLISSRNSPYLATYFDEHKTYEIAVGSDRNQADIDRYVEVQLDQRIGQKRIMIDERQPPSPKLRAFIQTKLCEEADGMFRWVSLQLDYICTLRTGADIRKRLGRLPKGLSSSYSEFYDRNFEKYDPEDRERLDIALSLLLLPMRPHDPDMFAKFVLWDNEDDSDASSSIGDAGDPTEKDDSASSMIEDNYEGTEALVNYEEVEAAEGEAFAKNRENTRLAERPSLDVEPYGASTYEITRLCFDLVVYDSTSRDFRFAHTSVQDYLQTCNIRYKNLSQCHARVAARCISLLLHSIQVPNNCFPKYPLKSEAATSPETDTKFGTKCVRVRTAGDSTTDDTKASDLPYIKVHSKHISTETLKAFELPWEWDEHDPKHVIIKSWISEFELGILVDHTYALQVRPYSPYDLPREDLISDDESEELLSGEDDDRGMFDCQPRLSTSLCQRSAEEDYWYYNTLYEPQSSKRLLRFAEFHWGFYAANSDGFRRSLPLKTLEAELQNHFACQSWEQVRPRIYYSACAYGLRRHVEAWPSAHPRLARTVQLYPSGTTALMEVCASEECQPEIAKILINSGAEIHRVPNMVFGSPLCVSVRQGHEAIARLLLEKDRSLLHDPASPLFSPLYWALNQAHYVSNAVPVIRVLLDFGANVNGDCSPFHNQSPLHIAARSFTPGLIELLLERGASIDSRNGEHRMTPLMFAVLNGVPENCKLLLACGADVHLKDRHHSSVLHFAFEHEDTAVAKILLDSGIDINASDVIGGTALHRTLSSKLGAQNFVELLIRSKIDISAKLLSGETALHCASEGWHVKVVNLLLATGANPNVTDHHGRTPLWMAADLGQLESVEVLVKVTNDINTQNTTGHTALSKAAMRGHQAIVGALLKAGAEIFPQEPGPHSSLLDPEERLEWYGVDALLEAYTNNHQSIVRLLLVVGAERDPSEYRQWLKLWDQGGNETKRTFANWLRRRAARGETPEIGALHERVKARLALAMKENVARFAEKLGILDIYDNTSTESGTESVVFGSGGGSKSGSVDGEEDDRDHSGVSTAEPQTRPPLLASCPNNTFEENGRSGQISL